MTDETMEQLDFEARTLERESNVKRRCADAIRAAVEEIERLRTTNAELLAACAAAYAVLMGPDCAGTKAVYGAIDCVKSAIVRSPEVGS